MNIADMHVYFRQYAQKMGMQNVRAILPGQIDILINTAIVDMVNKIVRDNVGVRNDKLVKDYSKIGDVDALRTLQDGITISCSSFNTTAQGTYSSGDLNFGDKKPMYIINCEINYFGENDNEDYVYPIRLIDKNELAVTINDPILKPKFTSPIGTIDNLEYINIVLPKKNVIEHEYADGTTWMTYGNYRVNVFVNFLRYPREVSHSENRDCDLPEHLHIDILKYAAELYKLSVSKGSDYQPQSQTQQTTATK